MKLLKKSVWYIFTLCSLLLFFLSYGKIIPISFIETMGFVTGALCVLLVCQTKYLEFSDWYC